VRKKGKERKRKKKMYIQTPEGVRASNTQKQMGSTLSGAHASRLHQVERKEKAQGDQKPNQPSKLPEGNMPNYRKIHATSEYADQTDRSQDIPPPLKKRITKK